MKNEFFHLPCRRQDCENFNFCQQGLGQERPNKCREPESSNGIFVIQGETCSEFVLNAGELKHKIFGIEKAPLRCYP
jgi:hypothetical protein